MSERFRTVATFDLAYKADLAWAALDEAGIEAMVTDREIVSMEWLLSNAVGGVKLQVAESDVPRALEVLIPFTHPGQMERPVSDEELERQALAEAPDEDAPPPVPEDDLPPPTPADPAAPSDERDQYARRFMLASVFSIVFPPLAVYAVYLGLNAAFGSGPITRTGWRRIWFGLLFCVLMFAFLMTFLGLIGPR